MYDKAHVEHRKPKRKLSDSDSDVGSNRVAKSPRIHSDSESGSLSNSKRTNRIIPATAATQFTIDAFCQECQFEFSFLALSPTHVYCFICNELLTLNRAGNMHNVRLHCVGRSKKEDGLSRHMKKLQSVRDSWILKESERDALETVTGRVHCYCLTQCELRQEADLVANHAILAVPASQGKSFYHCNKCLFFAWPPPHGIVSRRCGFTSNVPNAYLEAEERNRNGSSNSDNAVPSIFSNLVQPMVFPSPATLIQTPVLASIPRDDMNPFGAPLQQQLSHSADWLKR